MRCQNLVCGLVLLLALGTSTVVQATKPEDTAATRAQGQVLFERTCLFCHGATGQGDGPAGWFLGRYASPRPRNFTAGSFKFRSTPSGDLPTDQDLFRTITKGIPGYMPSFASLSEAARWQIVAYVKSFYPGFRTETPVPLPLVGAPTPQLAESLDRGRALYTSFECHTCHGTEGRGDGPVTQAGELKDASGLQIQAADLTRPSSFKNGASLPDLVRTLLTGLDGTPMPSYAARLSDRETDAWDLAQYLRALSAESVP
ncbi:MAG: c-type cytochrome [Nitrospiraceae bacterium]|nr:c-type cytochrome [Nitrospiraceae bacterium]